MTPRGKMNLQQEVQQIVDNAKDAYRRGEITAEQFCDVTRIPLKDAALVTIYHNGTTAKILKSEIHVPAFARDAEQAEAVRYQMRNEGLT
jgi:hypothetical protein